MWLVIGRPRSPVDPISPPAPPTSSPLCAGAPLPVLRPKNPCPSAVVGAYIKSKDRGTGVSVMHWHEMVRPAIDRTGGRSVRGDGGGQDTNTRTSALLWVLYLKCVCCGQSLSRPSTPSLPPAAGPLIWHTQNRPRAAFPFRHQLQSQSCQWPPNRMREAEAKNKEKGGVVQVDPKTKSRSDVSSSPSRASKSETRGGSLSSQQLLAEEREFFFWWVDLPAPGSGL
jgi:hypothetical protein